MFMLQAESSFGCKENSKSGLLGNQLFNIWGRMRCLYNYLGPAWDTWRNLRRLLYIWAEKYCPLLKKATTPWHIVVVLGPKNGVHFVDFQWNCLFLSVQIKKVLKILLIATREKDNKTSTFCNVNTLIKKVSRVHFKLKAETNK